MSNKKNPAKAKPSRLIQVLSFIHSKNKYLLEQLKQNKSQTLQIGLLIYLVMRVEQLHEKLDWFAMALDNVFGSVIQTMMFMGGQIQQWLEKIYNSGAI